ncbi:MAG TPA: trehalose-phosphatase [Phycisphaerae bacterium]|jgi:trehalose 6-phosphate phosphatase|nr:trehalose-phosphatase [Phycisphaerae bacterium]HOB76509.1 trehalose-phosphatase [Phycisphaerae bacterium]HOJ56063.1 trehalose-phosphatase [Phycisphaerae bacterium]HOL28307.1 trehalose-phosphatase [Phycisphaerae bacterium]HPP22781.1 trehalose-phosphatase [Phycisphaerae bacterium]
MDDLNAALEEIARTPLLLVASDFDGTIAPIVSNPAAAEADRESLVAIKALAEMPQTHVAIISGRALADLALRTVEAEGVHLVGSHGSEFEAGFASALSPQARETRGGLIAELERLAQADPGFLLEEKPTGAAFHYRNVEESIAQPVIQALLDGPGRWPGVHVRRGKKVIELSVVETNKGVALNRLRQRLGATAVLFLGDDLTDEDAFAALTGPDVSIKVGDGETRAAHRLESTLDVARMLATLAELRAAWLAGSEAVPIEQHALLSDQRTMALVNPYGRVVWLCLPRLDSAALFAELMGGATAGFFEVCPAGSSEPGRQSYIPDSFVLRTEWPGLVVTDYLDCAAGRAFQRAGRTDLVRVVEGHGRVRVTFAPRLDFGRTETRLRVSEDGLEIEGSLDPIVLRSPGLRWELTEQGRHQTAVAEVELNGRPLVLELRYGTGNLAADFSPEPLRRERNARFWANWAHSLTIPPIASELVRRSALVLRALIYGPTGAISAAATTSLPEHAGGVRNWDYRFCWPRDAAMAATALVRLGAAGPAMRFLDWVLGILEHAETSGMLRPVYSVTGGHLAPEAQVAELSGYLGSRPVRIGNMAGQQVQLDVFGPIADLLAELAERGAALSSEHWRMLEKIVATVEERWREPDHGIWEVRLSRQHYVHSKVMCWQTVDRALLVARYLGKKRPGWTELRAAIAEDVLANGYRPECNAFGAVYGGCEADAATLVVGLSGLLPPDDPRFIGTVDYVEKHLCTDNTVYRYRYDDGLPGMEGSFLLCTSWLIEACVLCGRMKRAWELFDALCAKVGPTGLISEEWDPEHCRSLGNYPQAYSHLGLINAAVRLAEAER